MTEGRTWTPIPNTRTREYCTVSEGVRVVRELLFFSNERYFYEVQTHGVYSSWQTLFGTEDNAAAFRQARNHARARSEEVMV